MDDGSWPSLRPPTPELIAELKLLLHRVDNGKKRDGTLLLFASWDGGDLCLTPEGSVVEMPGAHGGRCEVAARRGADRLPRSRAAA